MGELTKNLPKPLVSLNGETIIENTLRSLPDKINRVIVVVGYLGDKVKNYLGSGFGRLSIDYIEQNNRLGTADALWCARELIDSDKFLVLNGDDVYDKNELEEIVRHDLAFGVTDKSVSGLNPIPINIGEDDCIIGQYKPIGRMLVGEGKVATGAYVLDRRIFNYQPVAIGGGEMGLPQTILSMAGERKVKAVYMNNWLPINTLENLKKAEEFLSDKK